MHLFVSQCKTYNRIDSEHHQRSATRHHLIAIPLCWKSLGSHLELLPRQPDIRATDLDGVGIMIIVLQ
ncbi:MAG: hypothetical protein IJR13_01840 [Bacteroidales bacterium]|nr:hypothetical protein [Bacteroidales bacterium]